MFPLMFQRRLSLASSAAYGGCWRSVCYGCITPVSASAVILPPSLCLYATPPLPLSNKDNDNGI